MKKVLITGSNGLIGSSLVRQLVDNINYTLFCLGTRKFDNEFINFIPVDLSKDWNESKLPSQVDIIIAQHHQLKRQW